MKTNHSAQERGLGQIKGCMATRYFPVDINFIRAPIPATTTTTLARPGLIRPHHPSRPCVFDGNGELKIDGPKETHTQEKRERNK